MTTSPSDTLEQSLYIGAPPETVWRFWVDPERLASWWGAALELDATPGGPFVVEINEEAVMVGEFLEVEPPERLVFTFGWKGRAPAGPLAPGSTRVEVLLEQEGDGTRLVLRHHDLPAVHTADHEDGWRHFLGVLAERAAAAAV